MRAHHNTAATPQPAAPAPAVVEAAQLRSRYVVDVCETGRNGKFEEKEHTKKKI